MAVSHNTPQAMRTRGSEHVANATVAVVLAGMVAAWLAAGSTGFLAQSLQHALTLAALAVAWLVAWPQCGSSARNWAVLVGSMALAVILNVTQAPGVGVFGVAVVLAAIAYTSRGLASRLTLITAWAVVVFGLFRLACSTISIAWLLADAFGGFWGRTAGWLTGCPLHVGATFAGLDFLALMTAVYLGWLFFTEPPRRNRAVFAAVAIVAGHLVYLTLLAYSEKFAATLPQAVAPAMSESNHVGLSSWSGGLRSLIPWNMPFVAMVLQATIAAFMFRWAKWQPVEPSQNAQQYEKYSNQPVAFSAFSGDLAVRFGPLLLAALIPPLVVVSGMHSDLKGKTIVAFDQGQLNWLKPEYEKADPSLYGMLPLFVESLGGRFVKSTDLSEKDLAEADVVLLIHPDKPWPKETLERVWTYVDRGGSLLVAGEQRVDEGNSHSSFNDVLLPTAMTVRYDTAMPCIDHWEQSYQVFSHPATLEGNAMRNSFGIEGGASIQTRWPARPVLVGRWGWSEPGSDFTSNHRTTYQAGELLGDLVLAAEQRFGQGRVFVLGDTSPLRNESLAVAYPFTGRLLSYLAQKTSSPQAGWRQCLASIGILALIVLLAWHVSAETIVMTMVVLCMSWWCCYTASERAGRVVPDGRLHTPNNVAYIDASHLEAYSGNLWSAQGVSGLIRTLMRQNYLPLMLNDMTKERLERAALLISIAPARSFTQADRAVMRNFMNDGGTWICAVGAEEAGVINPFLKEEFGIRVPTSPVVPGENTTEPVPLGQVYGQTHPKAMFCGVWPIEFDAARGRILEFWGADKTEQPTVVSQAVQKGSVVVIGSTLFPVNEHLEYGKRPMLGNIRFWRWLLGQVVKDQPKWEPAADLPDELPAPPRAKNMPAQADNEGDENSDRDASDGG